MELSSYDPAEELFAPSPEDEAHDVDPYDLPAIVDELTFRVGRMRHERRRAAVLSASILAELEPLLVEVAQMQSRLDGIAERAEAACKHHQNCIDPLVSLPDVRAALGKTIPTAYGVIKTRQVSGKTEIDEEALALYIAEDPIGDYIAEQTMKTVPDAKAIRERFAPHPKGTVEKESGVILPVHMFRQTEDPHITVTVVTDGE